MIVMAMITMVMIIMMMNCSPLKIVMVEGSSSKLSVIRLFRFSSITGQVWQFLVESNIQLGTAMILNIKNPFEIRKEQQLPV